MRARPASGDGILSDTIDIRTAETGDLVFLEACANEAYERYVEAIGQKPAPMVFDFQAHLNEMPIEIMEHCGNAVGYLVWHLNEDHLFLVSIAIGGQHQGRGFARQAIAYLETKAVSAGRKSIVLYTNEKMTENLTLYPHLGFVEIRRRREDGFNRVYFRKSLP